VPEEQRDWLRCDILNNGVNVVKVICPTKRGMPHNAARQGVGELIYMDAKHGMQKHTLKLVTVNAKDEEDELLVRPATLPARASLEPELLQKDIVAGDRLEQHLHRPGHPKSLCMRSTAKMW
jgi:hypothetical protein